MPRKKQPQAWTALPQIPGEIWEVGRRALNVQVAEFAAKGEQPELVLVVHAQDSGTVVLGTALPSSAPPEALREILQQAMRQPMFGPPRRPERVRVGSQAEATALRDALAAAGVTVDVASQLAILDLVAAEAMHVLAGVTSDYRTCAAEAGEPLSETGLRELFQEARKFYREALWESFDDRDIFVTELRPSQGVPRTVYGIIMGSMGEEFGLALYPSLDDLQRLYEVSDDDLDQMEEDLEGPEAVEMAEQFLSIPSIGLTFTPQNDVPPPLVQEAKHLKLPLANASAYPLVLCTGEGHMQLATAADLRDMLTAIRAILVWDKQMSAKNIEDNLNVPITAILPAVADFLPALAVQTTLIVNPFLEEEMSDDAFIGDVSSFLEALRGTITDFPPPPPRSTTPKASSRSTTAKTGQKATASTPKISRIPSPRPPGKRPGGSRG
jgi:hypothetical protein